MSKPRTTGVAPGFLLLPAREYSWELQRKIELRLPRKGSIGEILGKDRVPSNVTIGGEDEFNIFEDNVVLLWDLVRLMFAGTRYPWLEDDECLNVVALEFTDEEVVLYGEIIKSLG
jgi:hypothetical protein